MAVESKRGCGYRKVGGLYLVSNGVGEACERLPMPIDPCSHCGEHLKQTRSFQWVLLSYLLDRAPKCQFKPMHCPRCLLCNAKGFETQLKPQGKIGLIWVGEAFYPTPEHWMLEARTQGISRRISTLPKEFKIGESWIAAAHPKVPRTHGDPAPAVFNLWKPTAVELIVTSKLREQEWVKAYEKKGVKLVEVPEDDADHAPQKTRRTQRQNAVAGLAKPEKRSAEAGA